MQRVFVCHKKSTCPLFDYTWDWLVDARPPDISSLVFLFFQFARDVDDGDAKEDVKSTLTRAKHGNSLTGTRETLRVVFEPPVQQRTSRRLKERIMRYANNINALASRTSRLKASRSEPQQSVAMVTAANEQIRVAVFCDALFNVELSHQIAEQILQRFASSYTSTLKELEPAFAEEANDQNEARTKLKYMDHFKDFAGLLIKLVEKHPKSTLFSQATITSSEDARSRIGSRLEEVDEKAGQVAPVGQNQDTVKKEKRKKLDVVQKRTASPRIP